MPDQDLKSGWTLIYLKINLWRLTPDPIEDLAPIQSRRSYVIMQIFNEKPQIDEVFEALTRANGQEFEQKDRYTDAYEIYSRLREFGTANFVTQIPEIEYQISFNTSTLFRNSFNAVESDLNNLQRVGDNSSYLKSELFETGLQIVMDWAAEPCFCPLIREDWN